MNYQYPDQLITDALIQVMKQSDPIITSVLIKHDDEVRANINDYYNRMSSIAFKTTLRRIRQTMQKDNYDFSAQKILELNKESIREFLELNQSYHILPPIPDSILEKQAYYQSQWLQKNFQFDWNRDD